MSHPRLSRLPSEVDGPRVSSGLRPDALSLLVAALLLGLAVGLWLTQSAYQTHSADFTHDYTGGRLVATGHLHDLYMRSNEIAVLNSLPRPHGILFAYTQSPMLAILLAPFGSLPYDTAYACWEVL